MVKKRAGSWLLRSATAWFLIATGCGSGGSHHPAPGSKTPPSPACGDGAKTDCIEHPDDECCAQVKAK
jgi:hypothetical protein